MILKESGFYIAYSKLLRVLIIVMAIMMVMMMHINKQNSTTMTQEELNKQKELNKLYGYKVETQLDRDRNTAVIWCGILEDMDPIIIDKPTSPLDILPTLLNLFGCEWDSRLYIGRDVLSDAEGLYFDSGYNWKTEVGYYRAGTGTFYPNPGYEEVGDAYIRRLNAIVANKISFNRSVINNSYFPYVYSILAEQHAQQAADSSQGEGEY